MLTLLFFLLSVSQIASVLSNSSSISFNGFTSRSLFVDGVAQIQSDGVLRLSNASRLTTGHAFFSSPFVFRDSEVFSFSTYFVFRIVPAEISGQGLAFVVAPTLGLPGGSNKGYMGLFNDTNNGNASNHVFAVEFDTFLNDEFNDTNDNHVGININSMFSVIATPAGYYDDRSGSFSNLQLNSTLPMQAWVDYNGSSQTIDVTIAPLKIRKPLRPLISLNYDLSAVINQNMYVGFSTAAFLCSHYVLGWSFAINGPAPMLDIAKLPPWKPSMWLVVVLPLILGIALICVAVVLIIYLLNKLKYSELIEDWEAGYKSHRFKYKDLYIATRGFSDTNVLGQGGFGKVYRGLLTGAKDEIAVKRISDDSRQGAKEFVAEIVSIGRLSHRNLVPLLGYCRRRGELLLVYECMPNGNLDKYIHGKSDYRLNWSQRFHIIKGISAGLFYLHEGWEQVVVHRDIKPSNVLLDEKWNAKLSDFGLARLHEHGGEPSTTKIVGTLGYIAPEHTQTGRATKSSDVYAFGTLLLEVVTGKRPTGSNTSLADLVYSLWMKNEIVGAVDPTLEGEFSSEEAELVLKIGLMCSLVRSEARPSMRDITNYLEDPSSFPDFKFSGSEDFSYSQGFDDVRSLFLSSSDTGGSGTMGAFSISTSLVYGGR